MATSKTCNDTPVIARQSSCNYCEFAPETLDLPIRAETRTITMRHDQCPVKCPPAPIKFESRRTSTKSGQFTRNNCPAGKTSLAVTYYATQTVLTSSAISQADADALAQSQADAAATADVAANGQSYANAVGQCK